MYENGFDYTASEARRTEFTDYIRSEANLPKTADPYRGHKMKWYLFLTRFSIWASVVWNLIIVFRTYSACRKLETLVSTTEHLRSWEKTMADQLISCYHTEIFMGIVIIVVMILAGVKLCRLKQSGPPFLYAAYVCGIVNVLWTSLRINGIEYLPSYAKYSSGEIWGQVAANLLLLVLNVIYFRKRSDVFVN